jgi:hypothetical protein
MVDILVQSKQERWNKNKKERLRRWSKDGREEAQINTKFSSKMAPGWMDPQGGLVISQSKTSNCGQNEVPRYLGWYMYVDVEHGTSILCMHFGDQ